MLAIYVIYTGMQRFRFLHLHIKAKFAWKQHVSLGTVALLLWSIGLAGGFVITRNVWYTNFITGLHAKVAVAMCPLIVVGFATGIYMNRVRKKRVVLPLVHGINNTILFLLAICQIYSGWQVMQKFVIESAL
jgi:tellurite resistance protein TehA-like permease